MKSKQLVLIAIALLCGLVSAIGIIQAMGSNKAPVVEEIPKGPVLVASAHLDVRTELNEENVSLEEWPLSLIPEGAGTEMTDVKGKFITTRLRTGQAIITEDVMARNDIPVLAIPPDHKLINIKVPSEDLHAGLLRPGDRVDIIGIFNTNRRGELKSETKTFLKGIRVFNIGNSTSAQDQKKNGSASGIVGVLVTERQSEKIVWAKKNGEIRLAMIGDSNVYGGPDPDFPMDEDSDEPEVDSPGSLSLAPSESRKPKFDMSKLRQVKVYSNGSYKITFFDEDGNQVEVPPHLQSKMPASLQVLPEPSGSATKPSGSGAKEELEVDYEGLEDSVDFPNGTEEDQYQGE